MADNSLVEQPPPTWTFSRGDDRLQISRADVDDGVMLVVAGDGAPRSYFFREIGRLEVFQRDMETLLLKTGWTFVSFEPEQRRGRDRRGWPRKSDDRRRWWTDGTRLPRQPKPRTEPAAKLMPITPRIDKDAKKNTTGI
jgi:hypothetical protein